MNTTPDNPTVHLQPDASYLGHDLIFIISQPKAGSTLLQRILAGSAEIQTSAETWLMLHPIYGLRTQGIVTDYNARWAATGVTEFLENYADGPETYREGIRSFAATVYGGVLEKHGKQLFLDKTPRYTMIIEELYRLFPQSKYVLLFRNPLAILKSELHTYVGDDWQVLSRFEPDLLAAPARLIAARELLGDSATEVRYEDLVAEPDKVVRALCDFLGIDFDPGMLDYSDTPAPAGRMNDPVGIHRHTAPSTDSVNRWKELGADGQLRHFAFGYLDALGDKTISDMGYDPTELRAELRQTTVDSPVRYLFPWRLAITPRERWRLRDHIASAYIRAAQQKGRLWGAIAVLRLFWNRFSGGLKRLPTGPAA